MGPGPRAPGPGLRARVPGPWAQLWRVMPGDRGIIITPSTLIHMNSYIKQHRGGRVANIFKILVWARLPPKLGPAGLGTLMGEPGVKFRVLLRPPEEGRPECDNFLITKLMFDRCWRFGGWPLLNTFSRRANYPMLTQGGSDNLAGNWNE